MKRTTTVLYLMIGVLALLGCNSTSYQHPAIEGEWTEPVNGVCLSVQQIASTYQQQDHILLLVMAQNVSDKTVAWPGFRFEQCARLPLLEEGGYEKQVYYPANTRVYASPSEPRALDQYEQIEQLQAALDVESLLTPGEVRLYALRLYDPRELQQMARQLQRGLIYAHEMIWPGLNSHTSDGAWKLQLVYRPEGFPFQESENLLYKHVEIEDLWKGIEIKLPAIEIHWVPKRHPNGL
ncbi:MAG: hypothetical protein AAGB26_10010 [Planctomycetota bacterium]